MNPCPVCGKASQVHDSRPLGDRHVRRRRRCIGKPVHRWTTVEVPIEEYDEMQTVKAARADARAELVRALEALGGI